MPNHDVEAQTNSERESEDESQCTTTSSEPMEKAFRTVSDESPAGRMCGSGCLVAAAFVGPGTIASCSSAGSQYGLGLLWAITFSVVAAFVLQEMAGRLGLLTGTGLAAALRELDLPKPLRSTLLALVCAGVGLVSALFEAGNIAGAALGLAYLMGHPDWAPMGSVLIGVLAIVILSLGGVNVMQGLLALIVGVMSVVFIVCALMSGIDWSRLAVAFVYPQIPEGSLDQVLALIGTTIVCYNLFLQSSAVAAKSSLRDGGVVNELVVRKQQWWLRLDTASSIIMGGIISASIVVVAASAFEESGAVPLTGSLASVANQMKPLLGDFAGIFFYTGLLCAGVSSAITAPLAARLAVAEALGWSSESGLMSALLSSAVVTIGTILAALPFLKSVVLIIFAQVTNAIVLPLFAALLVALCSNKKLMGRFSNGCLSMILGWACVAITLALSIYKLVKLFSNL